MIAPVPAALLDQLAGEYVPPAPPPRPVPRPRPGTTTVLSLAVDRCRKYLNKVPPAVAGEHGHDRTYQAARIIWNDFGIDEGDGYPLLEEFNATCQPPWGEKDLRRKWDEAVKKGPGPEGRGHLLARNDHAAPSPATRNNGSAPPRPPAAPADPTPSGGLPTIVVNDRQYRDVEADALAALVAANDPPRVFVGNGCGLVDVIRPAPDQPLVARELDASSARPVMARVADWVKESVTRGGGLRVEAEFPPQALLTSFPARGDWPGVPHLRSIVSYPVYGPGWVLAATQGYHPEAGIYCDLGGLVIPPVPAVPDDDDVAAAKALILGDLFGDFPFVDQASRAHAVAMLVLPVVRHAIAGPTPLGIIDAPTEGTGKSLLAESLTLATVGEVPDAISPDVADDEMSKLLLATLVEGHPVVFFDNANRKLDSAALAAALTAKYKRGRILGSTKTIRARVNVCWLLTANNFQCTREMARRGYSTRLDAGVENPSELTGFRHRNLLEWVRENRPRLLWAVLVLVRNWLSQGKPPGEAMLGKFEEWSAVVGGILQSAGIPGMLANANAFRKASADQAGELPEFVAAWWAKYNSTPVISGDLFDMAKDSLESVLTAESEDGRRKQLGRFLKKQRDKVVGRFRIRFAVKDDGITADADYAGRPRFKLERNESGKRSPQVAAANAQQPNADDDDAE